MATGFCPNNNLRWNYKYKVAFALIDETGQITYKFIDMQSDPSTFLYGKSVKYTFASILADVPVGKYTLAVAIVDTTKANSPGIKLATTSNEIIGWTTVETISIKDQTTGLSENITNNIVMSKMENAWMLSGISKNSKVISVNGMLISQFKSTDINMLISTVNIPSGIYLIHVEEKGLKLVIKVTK